MSDDIVIRLRGQRTNSVLCDKAVDEIERLRADRDLWVKVADDLYLIHDDCPKDLDAPQANSQ